MTDMSFDFFINLVTNVFRAYLYFRLFKVYFSKRLTGGKTTLLLYTVFVCATQMVYYIFHKPAFTITTNILMLIALSFCYSSGIFKKFLMVSIWYIINMGCDIAAVYLLGDYNGGSNYNLTAPCISVMFFSGIEFALEKHAKERSRNELPTSIWWALIIAPIMSIAVMVVMLYSGTCGRLVMVMSNISLVVINLLFIFLYNHFVETYYEMYENMVYRERAKSYATQLSVLVENDKRIKSYRHDLKNHLIEIRNLAERNETKTLLDYVDSMGSYVSSPHEYCKSGNQDIDGMLNYLLSGVEEKGIKAELKISVPHKMKFSLFDLNVILGNLINNALEAASKCEDKWISIDMIYEKELLFIQIRNPFDGRIKKVDGEFMTTKRLEGEHGIGLRNVKRAVKKNGGTISVDTINRVFISKVMLYGGL